MIKGLKIKYSLNLYTYQFFSEGESGLTILPFFSELGFVGFYD